MPHCPAPIRILVALAVIVVLVTACSMPRLAYQQADWLLLREMDNYLDLRDGQREHLAQVLATHLSRHRAEQLPDIAQTLEEAGARAQRGFAEVDIRWALLRGRELLESTARLLLPTVASALVNLDTEQRRHLDRYLNEQIEEYAERHSDQLPNEERWERDTRRTTDRIEDWTDALSEEQLALVHDVSRSMPDIASHWVRYTRERRRDLIRALEAGASEAAIEALLLERWIRHDAMPAQLARIRDQRVEARIAMLARLDRTLDSVQREHLVNRLRDLAEDARSLLRDA